MKQRFAVGSGDPPVYVESIIGSRRKGVIILAGKTAELVYSSEGEFIEHCRFLTRTGIPFSVGGHGRGPADEVGTLQEEGLYPEPYLSISWRGPGEWLIYEITHNATPPWFRVDPSELLKE